MPKNSTEKFRVLEWLNFTSSELHKFTYGNLFATESWVSEPKAQGEFSEHVKHYLGEKLAIVNTKLEGNDYCIGKQFTIADAYLFTILSWSKHVGVDLSPYKNITAHQSRVYARPATKRAMKAEGLLK